MSDDFDVIICGSGPAGCTAALALGSSGLRVAIVEMGKPPGGKVCGDAIPAYAPKVLNTIDPAYSKIPESLNPCVKVNTCRIIAPNGKSLDLIFPEYGFICKRLVFDNFLTGLVEKLPNLTFFNDTKIWSIKMIGSGAEITTGAGQLLKARLVIGCDGAHSIVRRSLTDVKINPHHCSGAVRAYFKNVKDIPSCTFELHFLKDYLPGYFWIFPLPDNQANVGLGMPSDIIAGRKISLQKEMLRIIESVPYLNQRFAGAEMQGDIKGYLIPLGSQKVTISGHRFMLCGDAASLADPATGAGIGQAMVSGRYAGWHALKCFGKNDFSSEFMKGYDKAVYDKLWKENHRRTMIRETFIHYPIVFNSGVNLALRSKNVHNFFIKFLK